MLFIKSAVSNRMTAHHMKRYVFLVVQCTDQIKSTQRCDEKHQSRSWFGCDFNRRCAFPFLSLTFVCDCDASLFFFFPFIFFFFFFFPLCFTRSIFLNFCLHPPTTKIFHVSWYEKQAFTTRQEHLHLDVCLPRMKLDCVTKLRRKPTKVRPESKVIK